MWFKKFILSLIFYFILISCSIASIKKEIVKKLISTNNLSFDFRQEVDNKIESGNCTIKYPKLINCIYNNKLQKIMVSNGKSLVIKNRLNKQYYIYPLNKTQLSKILDKVFLINQIKNLEIVNNSEEKISFVFLKDNINFTFFFDKNSYDLVGWNTEDIYQNKVKFEIFNIKLNQSIDKKKFILPKKN
tara:strand:- start:1860 stop:2423 length:564 start_codon:yes stop_codon:yes gene_type:complete